MGRLSTKEGDRRRANGQAVLGRLITMEGGLLKLEFFSLKSAQDKADPPLRGLSSQPDAHWNCSVCLRNGNPFLNGVA
jgi:hypothetical protein